MKNKKLVRNTIAILSVVLMTTVMVLSSCGNTFDSEHANITIRLNGSGSGRAISDAEKSAATFNVYFNDSLVASNVSGTYNGTAVVGTTLKIRLDALVNGKRIARGEDTIIVMAGTNDVDVKLYEDREEIPFRELSTAQPGDVICINGKVLYPSDITAEIQSQTVAVVYKVDSSARKAWAVGIRHEVKQWCSNAAVGYNTDFIDLQTNVSGSAGALTFTGYQDGSEGWQKLKAGMASSDDTNQEGRYPAWEWVNSYARQQGLTGDFATGWYFPSVAELFDIWKAKSTVEASLIAVNGSTFGDEPYICSSQDTSNKIKTLYLLFGDGNSYGAVKFTGYNVCAVRQFTY